LKFIFSDYKEGSKKDFTYRSIVEELTRALYNYGVNELAGYLKDAIKEMDKKFVDYSIKKKWPRAATSGHLAKLTPLYPLANDPARHLQLRLATAYCQIGYIGVLFFVTMESPSTRRAPERRYLPHWRAALKDTSPCARPDFSIETSQSTIS
jgi:hypothetical protein